MSEEIVEIQFKRERKEYFVNRGKLDIKVGDYAMVEVDRGHDLGRVAQRGELAEKKSQNKAPEHGAVLRLASLTEIEALGKLHQKEESALKICQQKVEERELDMKLVDAEWQFDGNKVIFYFTAEKRVDFRQLVKDLAAIFKTRIELKQIGVRDEARRIGGCGRCGYKLCCTTFLTDFEPVTLRAAKDQRLSLNPGQISGSCGRLMCCLMFEREFYKDQSRRFPKEGKEYVLGEGRTERVSGLDLFNEQVELENSDGCRRKVPLDDFIQTARECPCRNNREYTRKKSTADTN